MKLQFELGILDYILIYAIVDHCVETSICDTLLPKKVSDEEVLHFALPICTPHAMARVWDNQ